MGGIESGSLCEKVRRVSFFLRIGRPEKAKAFVLWERRKKVVRLGSCLLVAKKN